MAEILSAGVFIEEVPSANQTVDAVSTSNMGIVGWATRGPVNQATLVTNLIQYQNLFGSLTKESLMGHQVQAFYQNGGKRAFVVRVVPDDAVKATGFVDSVLRDEVLVASPSGATITADSSTTTLKVHGGASPIKPSYTVIKWRGEAAPVADQVAAALVVGTANYAGKVTGIPAYVAGLKVVKPGTVVFKWNNGSDREVTVPANGIIADALMTGFFDHATGNWSVVLATATGLTGNLTVDFTPGTEAVSITDNGASVFPVGSPAVLTAPGSITYTTGAYSFTTTGPNTPMSGAPILVSYVIKAWAATAKAEGAWGSDLRLDLVGNADYYDKSTSSYTRFNANILLKNSESGVFEVKESYEELVLSDPTSAVYFPDVINELSDLLVITEPGSDEAPGSLGGVGRAVVIKGGTEASGEKTVSITLPNAPIAKRSLLLSWKKADGTVQTITDDGKGGLTGNLDPLQTATINYTTGELAVTLSAVIQKGTVLSAAYNSAATETTNNSTFSGGADGTFDSTHFSRSQFTAPTLAADFEGVFALDKIDEIMQVVVPDFAGDITVTNDLLDYAEGRANQPSGGDRFVILTTPKAKNAQDAVDWFRNDLGRYSKFAALYWPWVKVADPLSNNRPVVMPPLGHLAGIYARTDSTRNVGKSPAGTTDGALKGIIGLEYDPTQGDRDYVYPNKINPLISSAQTGKCVWGARTIAIESEWKYVSARRLFMFCEKSVFNATHWIVFENNGPALWSRIKTQLNGFFANLFNDGYFAGTSPKDAYFIVVDQSNNPQTSVDAGQVITDIGIAPNKPAEFVRFRFQQKSLS